MVAKKRQGRPVGTPQPGIPARLEQIRNKHGVKSLSDFHERLMERRGEKDTFDVSYSAVRNYHADRDPPLAYLRRVAEVFGEDLGWLVTGRVPFGMRLTRDREVEIKKSVDAHEAVMEGIRRGWEHRASDGKIARTLGDDVRSAIELTARTWRDQFFDARPAHVLEGEELDARIQELGRFGERMGRLFAYPMEELGVEFYDPQATALIQYAHGLAAGLMALQHATHRTPPLSET
jgi:hypothetical protein